MCTTTFYVTSPWVLVVYMVYFNVLYYIPQGTGGVYGVLHLSMLHPPRVLVVYMMYYIVLCYIPRGTGGVYGVLNRSMLHPPGYWWCTTSFYVTSPRVLVVYTLYVTSTRIQVVYMVYYIVLCYIPHCTSGVYGVLHNFVLHHPGYWWYIWLITS